jgi:hypothetical protein
MTIVIALPKARALLQIDRSARDQESEIARQKVFPLWMLMTHKNYLEERRFSLSLLVTRARNKKIVPDKPSS